MNKIIYKTGLISGFCAFAAVMAFIIAQALQIAGLLHFPWDEIMIYGFSLFITIPFLLLLLALHYTTSSEKKLWSHAALLFSVVYAVFVVANYVVQLAIVIPGRLKGASAEVAFLNQTPHSLFWYFDAVGYITMGIVALFIALAIPKDQKIVKLCFIMHSLTTPVIAFVYFYPDYSDTILLFAIPWAITAPAMMLSSALMFRKKLIKFS